METPELPPEILLQVMAHATRLDDLASWRAVSRQTRDLVDTSYGVLVVAAAAAVVVVVVVGEGGCEQGGAGEGNPRWKQQPPKSTSWPAASGALFRDSVC